MPRKLRLESEGGIYHELILAEPRLLRTWGPKKLNKVLQMKHVLESPPAQSTIGEILRRNGQSVTRRRSPRGLPVAQCWSHRTDPTHEVWTVEAQDCALSSPIVPALRALTIISSPQNFLAIGGPLTILRELRP